MGVDKYPIEIESKSYGPRHEKYNSHHAQNLESKGFFSHLPIEIQIVSFSHSHSIRLSSYLYEIHVSHAGYNWTIRRRYHHFWNLHQIYSFHKKGRTLRSKTITDSYTLANKEEWQEDISGKFPMIPDGMLGSHEVSKRMKDLENYLVWMLTTEKEFRNHPETLNFFEVSSFSFILHESFKGKEGLVNKRNGDGHSNSQFFAPKGWLSCFSTCIKFRRWHKMWFIVQDTFILGVAPKTGEIRIVLLYDKAFNIKTGLVSTGYRHGLKICNLSRHLILKTWTSRKNKEWSEALTTMSRSEQGRSYIDSNRYGSFAPVHANQSAMWFIDGQNYMSAVADCISNAKDQIFITGWWLTPEIELKRNGKSLRLDVLLKEKAEQGIQIFILLYKELQLALGLNSLYTKQRLRDKNIKIFRHPDHSTADVNTHLWAHHEKMVIIDQSIAFIGGIDLCYGRWDTNMHPLTDVPTGKTNSTIHKVSHTNNSSRMNQKQGFSHIGAVLKAAHEITVAPIRVTSPDSDNTNGEKVHNNDSSESEKSISKHRKSRLRKRVKKKLTLAMKHAKNKAKGKPTHQSSSDEEEIGIDNSNYECEEGEFSTFWNNNNKEDHRSSVTWKGKDYVNFIVKDIANVDYPDIDTVDRCQTPRMPWHDISILVRGCSAKDAARHFIQRWNMIKVEKAKNNSRYPFLFPKTSSSSSSNSDFPDVLSSSTNVTCQVLRSSSQWSAGIKTVECSIHEAMIATISQAQYYIYIENQFFITSSCSYGGSEVKNSIGSALFDRIVTAHKKSQVFRVYILLPLLPAFEGQVGSSNGNALRVILHYNYASICRNENSLWVRLERNGLNPMTYLCFCSLRTKGSLLGLPVTELIYIHSKLLIVDDKKVICGSSNINDRSLLGDRDSEVCLLIEDTEFDSRGVMNGASVPSGKFAGSLRRSLMREHLGENSEKHLLDPICESFYKDIWLRTASINTKIFDEIFLVIPNNEVHTLEECQKYEEKMPIAEIDRFAANSALKNIKGNLVFLPLDFLKKEELRPSYLVKEGLVPSVTWT